MDIDPEAGDTGAGTADLAKLLETAAGTLEAAGELVRLTVTLRPDDGMIQLAGASTIPMPDQRASIDRIAGVLRSDPQFRSIAGGRYSYWLQAALPDGIRLLALAVTPWQPRPERLRSTTTRGTAAMLRALIPWASTFKSGEVSELTVHDHGRDLSVQLALQDSTDPLRAVEAATAGLPVQIERRAMGAAARAMLTTGHYLRITADLGPPPPLESTDSGAPGLRISSPPSPPEHLDDTPSLSGPPERDAGSETSPDRVADLVGYAAWLREQRQIGTPPGSTAPRTPPVPGRRHTADTQRHNQHDPHRRGPQVG